MTPGIHPHRVRINTITMDPHPLSKTESGGNKMASKTRHMLIQNKFTINIQGICMTIFGIVTAC
mgnify:CR=1 FL=1